MANRSPYPADFVDNFLAWTTIISVFLLSSLLIMFLIWILTGLSSKLAKNRLVLCWWVYSGIVHIVMDGYYIFSPEFYKDNTSFYLAEFWKEYSKADSRFAARDSVVLTFDLSFAALGPPCLLAAYAIAAEKSYSFILQFAVSLGQIYAMATYFLGTILDENNYALSPIYYYAYCFGVHSIWIFVPVLICICSWMKICAAFQELAQKKN